MLKKTITYTDFNGVERTEDFYFNFTEAELVEMNFSEVGGLEKKLMQIIDSKSDTEIIEHFKEIVLSAYGVKSADGRRFVKNQEVREDFEHSPAYSIIFMEMLDEEKATEFINAILPKKIGKQPIATKA